MAHVSKIVIKMINRKIEGCVEKYLKKYQYGFRKQKGTREEILGMHMLMCILIRLKETKSPKWIL